MRFSFNDDWNSDLLINLVNKRNEKINPVKLNNEKEHKCIELDSLSQETGELLKTYSAVEQKSMKNKFYKNDILYGKLRPYLRKYYKPKFDGCCSSEIWVLNSDILNHDFLYQYIQTNKFNQLANLSTGSKMPRADWSIISESELFYPTNEEMMKIGCFLRLLDERIKAQIKIIEDYTLLKKSLIHQFFTMDNPNVKLRTLLTEINNKNKDKQIDTVLSVSNKLGFVKQSEQFEDREVASDDTSNYKIVHKRDYAYNPARINVGSIARLINYDKGIISPMYSCFKINEEKITYTYFDMFLASSSFKKQLNKKLEGSVRQCLTFEGMLSMDIRLPSIEIQKSISNQIDTLNNKIKTETEYLDALIKQKQFLLNNMFI